MVSHWFSKRVEQENGKLRESIKQDPARDPAEDTGEHEDFHNRLARACSG